MTSEATLKKLQANPHYKLSPAQKAELENQERKPMVEFGEVPLHQQTNKTSNETQPEFATHNTSVVKRGRKKKNEI